MSSIGASTTRSSPRFRNGRPEPGGRSFLRSLVERGLSGVRLVVSDAHAGLKKAIAQVLGCPWQRCSVHFLREALGHARREQQPMLAALIRLIFNADNGDAPHASGSARRSSGCASRWRNRGAARRRRRRPARLLQLPLRPLDETALHQPARALQPRDRPPHRRRRHLPQRPRTDPARRQRRDRTKRRMARRPPLPLRPLARSSPRSRKNRQRQRGGPRAHRGLTNHEQADELHHALRLDCRPLLLCEVVHIRSVSACRGWSGAGGGCGRSRCTRRSRSRARRGSSSGGYRVARPASATRTPRSSRCRSSHRPTYRRHQARLPSSFGERPGSELPCCVP
jgi:hypothetical protein